MAASNSEVGNLEGPTENNLINLSKNITFRTLCESQRYCEQPSSNDLNIFFHIYRKCIAGICICMSLSWVHNNMYKPFVKLSSCKSFIIPAPFIVLFVVVSFSNEISPL